MELQRELDIAMKGCICCGTVEDLEFTQCCGVSVCVECMPEFKRTQKSCSHCKLPMRKIKWVDAQGLMVLHRFRENVREDARSREEEKLPPGRINRWMTESMAR